MAAQGALLRMQACALLLLCLSEALAAASQAGRSYYDTLNVEPTATDSQIKKAFRKLAVKHHPDKNKSADAEKTFREIAEAYTVLSDKEKRRLYDSVGHEAFLEDGVSADADDEAGFPFSFSDFFHDFEGSPFMEEPHFHWSFDQDWEDEGSPYQQDDSEGPGFFFYFGDGEENEEEHHY